MHRRRSSVNFRGHQIFARKIGIKDQQNARILRESCPKNYQNTLLFIIFARKIYKIPEFYLIFARKMPEFYIIIVRKIFFPNFRGHVPPSPTPRLLRLWQSETGKQTYRQWNVNSSKEVIERLGSRVAFTVRSAS